MIGGEGQDETELEKLFRGWCWWWHRGESMKLFIHSFPPPYLRVVWPPL